MSSLVSIIAFIRAIINYNKYRGREEAKVDVSNVVCVAVDADAVVVVVVDVDVDVHVDAAGVSVCVSVSK